MGAWDHAQADNHLAYSPAGAERSPKLLRVAAGRVGGLRRLKGETAMPGRASCSVRPRQEPQGPEPCVAFRLEGAGEAEVSCQEIHSWKRRNGSQENGAEAVRPPSWDTEELPTGTEKS